MCAHILSVVEIPASEDERQGSNGGEAERLGSRTHLMTASLCYFHLVRIALCKDISLEGCHLLGTRSQAPLPCCLILTARVPARSGFRLRIRSAQDVSAQKTIDNRFLKGRPKSASKQSRRLAKAIACDTRIVRTHGRMLAGERHANGQDTRTDARR